MTMISESSFMTSSSHQSLTSYSNNLNQIQADVFNKVVNLKNQKIQLLSHLSQCIDVKYRAEAELKHQLQIKRRKQENLATKEQYQPVIYRNVQLKAEQQELRRQVLQKSSKTVLNPQTNINFGTNSRTKSVLDLSRHRDLYRSNHSQKKINEKLYKSKKLQNIKDNDDSFIDKIIQQRKANFSLSQVIREEINKKLERNQNQSIEYKIQQIKKRFEVLNKTIQDYEFNYVYQKLQKSLRPQKIRNQNVEANTVTGKASEHIQMLQSEKNKLTIKQMLRYIQQQQEEKRMFYEQLLKSRQQMEQMKIENQQMKNQLAARSMHETRKSKNEESVQYNNNKLAMTK